MRILGISAYYHDSAAALVVDGVPVAAAQEERFTRIKHDAGFPVQAIGSCLAQAGVRLSQLDAVVFYEKPFVKFERLLETYLSVAPRGFRQFLTAMPLWLREKLFQKSLLSDELKALDADFDPAKLLFSEHHLSHAASAFYPSPFERALVLTLDGVGEWPTSSVALGNGAALDIVKELHFPHSLGLIYSAFTHYTGFKVNSGEYKLMGLAPYGRPVHAQTILDHLVDLKPDGSFRLDQRYFDYMAGFTMTNARFEALFGEKARAGEAQLTPFHMDIAASIQAVTEEIVLRMTRALAAETGERNLCLAGGVALNCVANGKILRDGRFDEIWVQPASGDAGGALGAALAACHREFAQPRTVAAGLDGMAGAYLGPAFAADEIATRLSAAGAVFEEHDEAGMLAQTVEGLVAGKAVGWFQGRMEFGPRALGGRSILGDPRSPSMQKTLNLRVKFRESFRPFAPAVLAEDVGDWFEHEGVSPYMLMVAEVRRERRRAMTAQEEALFGIDKLNVARSEIPAVTHVDYSARLQTVHAETNPRFHALISGFKAATGCPVLVNTSFNVRGEPIVCTPEDAFRCFMGSDIEMLVVGTCVLRKERQDPALALDYTSRFELD
ncbi:carbamoyltransferase [Bosea sp. (in: a-proteobacteria)]|uniref:carbamoyltransferase family protein n=1 Tax=Bosea sp. (in: a-proteobacteria) TaxID=1871050 RepID=UPI00262FFAF4|nr:carbamoyltransferase [Bosea sp. (in: a-proteobacteria)]MCO5089814.1 carbamoyltransferase [Bosea sp. (in: a-proteobacteria)]